MKRPFTFINSAMSADGKISSFQRCQIRISGSKDLARVEALRAGSDAIMVGVGTILADNPSLRVKSKKLRDTRIKLRQPENPLRVVVDSTARTPLESNVLDQGCILAVSQAASEERLASLSQACEVLVCGLRKVDLKSLLTILYEKGVRRLMIEGGATLNWSLIKNGLVDEIYIYIGAMLIGGENAPPLVGGKGFSFSFPRLKLESLEKMDDGALIKWSISNF
ncbi:MAG: 2,5-diamino-6-(ribosylamino)-4(3H)-pyrimidinone 5'-phosphate reductase [Methanotrichaceae archaeon]|nr:2,5-diamino-6-(ribosylamino)-4(3H)-pyrimidinone 5'-phosphate reductase [Methanotrichaceae archaeon]